MVTQHYRWDFVGLSTDTKPTPANSEKVVDGSTYYEADTSKLYVYCKNNWYEKTAGGVQTFDFSEIYTLGLNALNESGETYVENVDITEEQYKYVLNNIKQSKFAIAYEKAEVEEGLYTVITMLSDSTYKGAYDEEWNIVIPISDGIYTFTGNKFTDGDENIYYTLSVYQDTFVVEGNE